ncbi:hypothetical protein EG329_013573 [Mollisiaceae sp. DMI_Dod_QoI]|nr:hypothetical protein EG329_013573 [Helotiales sp. DMI_Dod_QoI]
METPRRYFTSDGEYNEGKVASAAAWQLWQSEQRGKHFIRRSPWFELADSGLRDISRLIQSQNKHDFEAGLEQLNIRIAQSEQAAQELQNLAVAHPIPKWQLEQWQELVRKGPPILVGIAKHLQDDSRREQAIKTLANICDDQISAKTFRPVASSRQAASSRDFAFSRPRAKSTTPIPVSAQTQVQIKSHRQGEEFGLGYDPGEHAEATIRPADMFAPSVIARAICMARSMTGLFELLYWR